VNRIDRLMNMSHTPSRVVTFRICAVLSSAVLLLSCGSSAAFSLDSTLTRPPDIPLLPPADSIGPAADTMMSVWAIEDLDRILTTEAMIGGEPGRGGRKSSRVAVLCALVFPGLGQVYNEKPYKAAIAFGAEMFYLSRVYAEYRRAERERIDRDRHEPNTPEWIQHDLWMNEYEERMIDWIWWSAGTLLVVTLDAYVDAHLYDMRFKVEARALDRGAGLALVFDF
jgi:hypothetical protein